MVKNIVFLIFFIGLSTSIHPQYFNKVTNDPLVSNYTWSDGCAWGDYDNDSYVDVVVTTFNDGCWSCNFPIQLYHNNGNGTFTKVTTGSIINEVTQSVGCAWGDYDNDGKLDLFVCTLFGLNNLLFHNEGNGNFTKIISGVIVNDGGSSVACAWIDYDKDGWLDLFVANQGNDFLYHNGQNGTFSKITTGSIVNDGINDRSCVVADYDNDGWIDILITVWGNINRLYHNNGNGTFTMTSGILPSLLGYYGGAAFADYDNDGWLDLFISSFNSPTHNFLYHNNNGIFSQVSAQPSVDYGPQSFGCSWGDFDNDGLIDLFVTNLNARNFLYKNFGNGVFLKIIEPISNEIVYGLGSAMTDFNLDGKIDFFVSNNGATSTPSNNLLYQNIFQYGGKYIGIKLKGCNFNKSAIGTLLKVKAGGKTYIREVSGGGGYHTQDMLFQHFGIGNAALIDSIIVRWTTGNIQKLSNVTANQYIVIDECLIGLISYGNEIPDKFSLSQNYPNPFNPTTRIKFTLPRNSEVVLIVYDMNGKIISELINSELKAGYYEYEYEASYLSSGVYFYQLNASDFKEVKKMVLVK
jgi:hypothetical protein